MQGMPTPRRILPALAVVLTCALFVHLGNWQAGKADHRAADIVRFRERAVHGAYRLGAALVDAAEVQDAPVTVRGSFLPEQQFYIDNRIEDGQGGVHVITPLRVAGSQTLVLVNRGWIAWPDRQGRLPPSPPPAGEVDVNGVASLPSTRGFFLMPQHADERDGLWSRLDLQRYVQRQRDPVQPVVVLQTDAAADGLRRHWPEPEDKVAMHRSYALQWYAMAIALVLFFVVTVLRKRVKQ